MNSQGIRNKTKTFVIFFISIIATNDIGPVSGAATAPYSEYQFLCNYYQKQTDGLGFLVKAGPPKDIYCLVKNPCVKSLSDQFAQLCKSYGSTAYQMMYSGIVCQYRCKFY